MTPREEKFIDTITNVRVLLLTTHETYEWGQARMGRVALLEDRLERIADGLGSALKEFCETNCTSSAKILWLLLTSPPLRLIQGEVRYGPPKKEQNYMTRMIMEVKHYKRSGNMEQLINIANYALLESMAPENKKFHFDSTVDSVTRGKV